MNCFGLGGDNCCLWVLMILLIVCLCGNGCLTGILEKICNCGCLLPVLIAGSFVLAVCLLIRKKRKGKEEIG